MRYFSPYKLKNVEKYHFPFAEIENFQRNHVAIFQLQKEMNELEILELNVANSNNDCSNGTVIFNEIRKHT